jgi:glucose-1-phosphate cytidylyltransferase
VTYDYRDGKHMVVNHSYVEPWRVTIADTGVETMTGRIKRIQEYVGEEAFLFTYGDAVCDVNIKDLLDFHIAHGRIATMTSVIQKQEKGVLDVSEIGEVRSFREKHLNDGNLINAGYMVLQPKIFECYDR